MFELQTNIYCKNERISSSVPEAGSSAAFRNVVLKNQTISRVKERRFGQWVIKRRHSPVVMKRFICCTEEDLFLPPVIEPRSLGLSLHTDWDIPVAVYKFQTTLSSKFSHVLTENVPYYVFNMAGNWNCGTVVSDMDLNNIPLLNYCYQLVVKQKRRKNGRVFRTWQQTRCSNKDLFLTQKDSVIH